MSCEVSLARARPSLAPRAVTQTPYPWRRVRAGHRRTMGTARSQHAVVPERGPRPWVVSCEAAPRAGRVRVPRSCHDFGGRPRAQRVTTLRLDGRLGTPLLETSTDRGSGSRLTAWEPVMWAPPE